MVTPLVAPVDFSLYLITDRHQVPATSTLMAAVEKSIQGGCKAVQLREKDLSARELLPLAQKLRTLTRHHGVKLLINDRIDVALAVDADGVHLGGHSLPTVVARSLLGPDRLIGVSTHTISEIQTAADQGADFVTFGPVYYTPSKAPLGEPVGLDALKEACAASPVPVFALGGIKPHCLPEVRRAGAHGAAMISAVLANPHPDLVTQKILSTL